MRTRKRLLALSLVTLVMLAGVSLHPAPALASERSTGTEFLLGVGAVASTLLWGPAKIVFAVGGSASGGLAFLFTGGDTDVAGRIIQPAVRGNYVVAPEHLSGEQPLSFFGRDPARDPYPY